MRKNYKRAKGKRGRRKNSYYDRTDYTKMFQALRAARKRIQHTFKAMDNFNKSIKAVAVAAAKIKWPQGISK